MKLISNKRTYLLSDNGKPLGTLCFPKWYSSNAVIELKREKIEIKQKGFWGNKYLIIKKGFTDGSIKIDWKSQLTVEIKDNNKRMRTFMFKTKGMLKPRYVFLDERKKTVCTLHTISSWTKFKNDYDIEVHEEPESLDSHLLYLHLCFCVTIYNNQIGAASAGAIG